MGQMSADLPQEISAVLRDMKTHPSVSDVSREIFRRRTAILPTTERDSARRKAPHHELYPNEEELRKTMLSLGYEFLVLSPSE
jgi:hypothetical protein